MFAMKKLQDFRVALQNEKNGIKKWNVDKNELRYEILLYNYKKADDRREFYRIMNEYIAWIVVDKMETLEDMTTLSYYNFVLEYLNHQNFNDYQFSHLSHLITDISQNYIRRANFFGYSEDWKNEMLEVAYDNCCKYLKNYKETYISKTNETGISSAFSYVTQIIHTAFISTIKKKQNSIVCDIGDFESNMDNLDKIKELHLLVDSTQQTIFSKFTFFIKKMFENWKNLRIFIYSLEQTDECDIEIVMDCLEEFKFVEEKNYTPEDFEIINFIFYQDVIFDKNGKIYTYGKFVFDYELRGKKLIDIATEQLMNDIKKNPENFICAISKVSASWYNFYQLCRYMHQYDTYFEIGEYFGDKLGFRKAYRYELCEPNIWLCSNAREYFDNVISKENDGFLDEWITRALSFIYWEKQKFYMISSVLRAYEVYNQNNLKKPFFGFYKWFFRRWIWDYKKLSINKHIEMKISKMKEYDALVRIWGDPIIIDDEQMCADCINIFGKKKPFDILYKHRETKKRSDICKKIFTQQQMINVLSGN